MQIFENILGYAVEPTADFFISGGSSLDAIGAVNQTRRKIDRRATVRHVFDAHTAKALVFLLDTMNR